MRKAVLARRIPRSPPRSAPTRRIAASPSRPCSAAPNLDGGGELVRALAGRQTFSGIVDRLAAPGLGSAPAGHAFCCAAVRPPSRIFGLSRFWRAGRRDRRRRAGPAGQLPKRSVRQLRGESRLETRPPDSAADHRKRTSLLPRRKLPTAVLPRDASFDADGSESAPALPEAGEAETAAERTAEIYVLRQPALPPASNIVPIRPGALDGLNSREPLHGFPAESVELTRSERDAFREIARALVGRTPAGRDERLGRPDGIGDRCARPSRRQVARMSAPRPAAPTTRRFGATPAPYSTACRSAFSSSATRAPSTPTKRFSISSAIAISRNSCRRTGSRRCSATAIRKGWRSRMRARSRSSGPMARSCSSTGALRRSGGTARRRR